MIPKEEQLHAIVHARNWELANKYFNGNREELEKNWSITEEELIDYVIKNGFPKGWVRTTEETYDGIYILADKGKWLVYDKERGKIYEETKREFYSNEMAIKHVVSIYYTPESIKK